MRFNTILSLLIVVFLIFVTWSQTAEAELVVGN